MTDPTNPWARLPTKPPFVLPEDFEGAVPFQLHLRPPAPWTGRIRSARVVLLMRNPGHRAVDYRDSNQPEVQRLLRANLSGDEPFIWHRPQWIESGPGSYWGPILGNLTRDVGADRVAAGFAVAQTIPYSSTYEIKPTGRIPSSSYTARLVEAAQRRGAILIIGRARREWASLLAPQTLDGPNVFELGTPRGKPFIRESRIGADLYRIVVAKLLEAG